MLSYQYMYNKEATYKWREKNKQKHTAHKKAYWAIFSGIIKKSKCEICGGNGDVAHHEDYTKPLEIMWLCRSHHYKLHQDKRGNKKILQTWNFETKKYDVSLISNLNA